MLRIIDLIILIIVILPSIIISLIVVFFYIYKKEGKPYIYKGIRLGKNDKIFYQYKFRTLKNNSEQQVDLKGNIVVFDDDLRLNKVGKLLRSTHLDELPQLINILKGEMSFVGPRPIPPETTQIYEYNRHSILPGLVGLQVLHGRNLSWKNKQRLDFFYLIRINFYFYFYILLLALKKIIINLIKKIYYEHIN